MSKLLKIKNKGAMLANKVNENLNPIPARLSFGKLASNLLPTEPQTPANFC